MSRSDSDRGEAGRHLRIAFLVWLAGALAALLLGSISIGLWGPIALICSIVSAVWFHNALHALGFPLPWLFAIAFFFFSILTTGVLSKMLVLV